jgi:hypothetical protein
MHLLRQEADGEGLAVSYRTRYRRRTVSTNRGRFGTYQSGVAGCMSAHNLFAQLRQLLPTLRVWHTHAAGARNVTRQVG